MSASATTIDGGQDDITTNGHGFRLRRPLHTKKGKITFYSYMDLVRIFRFSLLN